VAATGAATANITAALLNVTGLTVSNKSYDGTNSASLGGSAAVTALGGDVVTIGGTASGTFADKNFGTGKAVTVTGNTLSGADATNYTLVQQTGLTADIGKANLTLSTSNVVKTYDAGTSALGTATVKTGMLFGSDSLSGGSFAFTNKNAGVGNKTVTTTGVTVNDGNSGNNYAVTFADNTTSTITPATLNVTGLTAISRAYNGTNVAGLGGLAAITALGDDVVTVVGTATGTFADKNFGTGKAVTVTGNTLSGADATNYTLVQQTGLTANIDKASLTLSTSNVVKTYDAGTSALGTAVVKTGTLFSGDSLSGGSFAFLDKNVGNANRTVTTSGVTVNDGNSGNNYTVGYADNTSSTINPATLSVNFTGVNRVYDATTAATVTASDNRLGSDVLTINRSAAFLTKDVASGKTIHVTGVSLGGTDAGNYTVASTGTATANITPATLSVTYTGVNRVYDATTNAAVTTSDNHLASDVLTINRSAAFATKDVGNGKTIHVTGVSLGGTDAGNYTVASTGTATANVSPATLTYVATPAESYSSTILPVLTGAVTGFLGADTLGSATTGSALWTSNAKAGDYTGQYGIFGSGLLAVAGNYTFVQAPANASALSLHIVNPSVVFVLSLAWMHATKAGFILSKVVRSASNARPGLLRAWHR